MYIDFAIEQLQEFVIEQLQELQVELVDSGKYAVSVDGILHLHQSTTGHDPRLRFPRGKLAVNMGDYSNGYHYCVIGG